MSRNVAILAIPFELLERALGLPDGVRIDEVRESPSGLDMLELRLEGECFKPVPIGNVIPSIRAEFRSGEARAELYDGSQKLAP